MTSGPGVVIVGAGQAGFQTATSLRAGGYEGAITLFGEEPELPYERPPLSKSYLSGEVDDDGVWLRPATHFDKHRIALRSAERVEAIERRDRRVVLTGGTELPYIHLVLATGARARQLPIGEGVRGVEVLRSLDDARRLRSELVNAPDVVVVGGGFIGLEFAAVARSLGCTVTIVEALDRPMNRVVSDPVAQRFQAEHERRGTQLLFESLVTQLETSEGTVSGVTTANGARVRADLVVVGIGVSPEVTLAEDAGLHVRDGSVVDDHLVTSDWERNRALTSRTASRSSGGTNPTASPPRYVL